MSELLLTRCSPALQCVALSFHTILHLSINSIYKKAGENKARKNNEEHGCFQMFNYSSSHRDFNITLRSYSCCITSFILPYCTCMSQNMFYHLCMHRYMACIVQWKVTCFLTNAMFLYILAMFVCSPMFYFVLFTLPLSLFLLSASPLGCIVACHTYIFIYIYTVYKHIYIYMYTYSLQYIIHWALHDMLWKNITKIS